MVMVTRSTFRDEKRSVSMVIRSLACSDFLMGLYLLVISFYDVKLRDVYHENADAWTDSWGCILAGILSVVSSEVSILILTFMSVERFLLISEPFSHHRLNTKNVLMALYIIWLVGISIAVLPAILYQNSNKFYGIHNGFSCFPLFIQEKYSPGWPFSAFIVCINLILLLLIATLYTVLLFSIWQTRRATKSSISTPDFFDCEFAIRFEASLFFCRENLSDKTFISLVRIQIFFYRFNRFDVLVTNYCSEDCSFHGY
jgi:relaxin family peptide receptor 2